MKILEIYYTSDIHGHLYPTDYTDNNLKSMGLLAIGSSIKKTPNTLIMDGGDTIQGSPFLSYYIEQHKQGKTSLKTNPMAETMNQIGYDYITLGNHDFNFGDAFIRQYLNDSNAQCLCANIEDKKDHKTLIKSTDIRTMPSGLKVGIIGLTTDHINVWERKEHLTNFSITDPMTTAKALIASMRNSVDILIGLYHGGFENDITTHENYSTSTENIGYKLCETLDFDLLLTGHQHMAIADSTLHGTHIVQTPSNGTMYAHVKIEVDEHNSMSIYSELLTPGPHPQATVNGYPSASKVLNDTQVTVQQWLDIEVGSLDALLKPDDHITMAMSGTPLANFLNQVQLATSGADISCTSLGNHIKGMGSSVSLRDIVSTYVFPNTLVVLEVTGEQLYQALERCAQYFDVVPSANDTTPTLTVSQAFLKPKVEHYNYDYFTGIHYTFDVSKPVGSRVVTVIRNGATIETTDTFRLVMNTYRATGTGGYDVYSHCPIIKDLQITTSDMVTDYIKQHPRVKVDKTQYITIQF